MTDHGDAPAPLSLVVDRPRGDAAGLELRFAGSYAFTAVVPPLPSRPTPDSSAQEAENASVASDWRLTLNELLWSTEVYDYWRGLLGTDRREAVMVTVSAPLHTPQNGTDLPLRDQAAVYARLAHLQGDAVARCYGLWHGSCWAAPSDIDPAEPHELYLLIEEDLGESIGEQIGWRWADTGAYAPALRRLSETMHAAGVVAGNGRPSLYDIYVRPAADGTVRLCVAHFGDVLLADETGFEEALAVEKRFLADHLPAPCE